MSIGRGSGQQDQALLPTRDERAKERSAGLHSWHLAILGLTLVGVALCLLLESDADGAVRWGGASGWRWPVVCPWRQWAGADCPGCGLTRSLVLLGRGDLQAAWQAHRLGWLVALLVLVQVPYRLWALLTPDGRPLGRRFPTICVIAVCLFLMLNWVLRQWM